MIMGKVCFVFVEKREDLQSIWFRPFILRDLVTRFPEIIITAPFQPLDYNILCIQNKVLEKWKL